MIRVLFIARYRDATMHRKVELLAQQPDLSLCYIMPRFWQDEFVQVEQSASISGHLRQVPVTLVGRAGDPHRTLYRTLSFEMNRFQPHIIHAEEEPDSLAALQVVFTRRLLAPQGLALYTWQNTTALSHGTSRPWRCADARMLSWRQEAADLMGGCTQTHPVLPAIGVDTRVLRSMLIERRLAFIQRRLPGTAGQ
jgi:hypothetical protein